VFVVVLPAGPRHRDEAIRASPLAGHWTVYAEQRSGLSENSGCSARRRRITGRLSRAILRRQRDPDWLSDRERGSLLPVAV